MGNLFCIERTILSSNFPVVFDLAFLGALPADSTISNQQEDSTITTKHTVVTLNLK
jgi:hypothetical protein